MHLFCIVWATDLKQENRSTIASSVSAQYLKRRQLMTERTGSLISTRAILTMLDRVIEHLRELFSQYQTTGDIDSELERVVFKTVRPF